ncbi:MAG: hypothetical protein PHX45_00880 [Acidobacteriota bacterium]|nr:hypothetical protein [Acidobacteriota bacterium]
MKQKMLIGTILAFMFVLMPVPAAAGDAWREVRLDNEVIVIRSALEEPAAQGQAFGAKGRMTSIRIATDLGEAGRAAAADIARYFPLACGGQARVSGKKPAPHDFTLLLATAASAAELSGAGIAKDAPVLGEQECLILPLDAFPDGTPGVALVGGSARGLLNGVYALLERSAGIYWEPARNLRPRQSPPAGAVPPCDETTLEQREKLVWTGGAFVWKPAVSDRILYIGSGAATPQAISWASRNRLSHLIISTPHDVPWPEAEDRRLKTTVDYAHGLGMKVLFLGMTHRLPSSLQSLKPSSPEALKASTELYAGLFSRFDLDGFAWHTASEGIKLAEDEAFYKKPRMEWEALYFNSYYSAIRKIKKDALLVMLMGWVYMNPAPDLARLLPADTVAWVVPNTPIIDAALTDIPGYDENFDRVWYWLYVTVSRDGAFQTVKLDYLEKYFAEAFKRGHGLAPQGVIGNNAVNAMYFVQVARDGLIPHADFLKSFAARYFGDPRIGDTLLTYQQALYFHRNWYNNVHTVDIRNYLTFEEKAQFQSVFEDSLAAARAAKSPLFKDRLRGLAATTLRCILRRTPQPPPPGKSDKDWGPEWDRIYGRYREEFLSMFKQFAEVFGEPEAGAEDLYWGEMRTLKSALP